MFRHHRRRSRHAAWACLALALGVAGCGSSSPSSSHTSPASRAQPAAGSGAAVAIRGYAFKPVRLVVRVGARVTFTNDDATDHTATSTSGAFDSGTLAPGRARTITFSKPGTYTYYCQFHAFMRAQITVVGAGG